MCKVRIFYSSVLSINKRNLTFCRTRRRYLETDVALQSHWRSKVHKRRCKALKEPAYTIEESERAAGMGREGKRPETSGVVDVAPVAEMAMS